MKKEQNQPLARTEKKKRLSDKRISQIFVIFDTEYGTAWTKDFTSRETLEAFKARWAERLFPLNYKQIKYGLENMGKKFVRFPPNLNEFIALCEQEGAYKPKTAAHRDGVVDTPVITDRSVGREALKKIKAGL